MTQIQTLVLLSCMACTSAFVAPLTGNLAALRPSRSGMASVNMISQNTANTRSLRLLRGDKTRSHTALHAATTMNPVPGRVLDIGFRSIGHQSVHGSLRSLLQGLCAYFSAETVDSLSRAFHADSTSAAAFAILCSLFSVTAAMTAFLSQPMDPAQTQSSLVEDVLFTTTKEGWLLCEPADGSATDQPLFIFYCGAKLDPTHYRGLAQENARLGIATLIVQSPLNLSMLPPAHPRQVMAAMSRRFSRFVLGGHSLGAVKSVMFASELAAEGAIDGLVLLGCSPNGLLDVDLSSLRNLAGQPLPTACLHADNDGFFGGLVDALFRGDHQRYLAHTRALLPRGGIARSIRGGTHFGFADATFGPAQGFPFPDGELATPRQQQHRQTAQAIAEVAAASAGPH